MNKKIQISLLAVVLLGQAGVLLASDSKSPEHVLAPATPLNLRGKLGLLVCASVLTYQVNAGSKTPEEMEALKNGNNLNKLEWITRKTIGQQKVGAEKPEPVVTTNAAGKAELVGLTVPRNACNGEGLIGAFLWAKNKSSPVVEVVEGAAVVTGCAIGIGLMTPERFFLHTGANQALELLTHLKNTLKPL